MKLFTWLRNFHKSPKPTPKGKLCCAECGRSIHKHDRYQILTAKHRDCMDTKLVGQQSLPKSEKGRAAHFLQEELKRLDHELGGNR